MNSVSIQMDHYEQFLHCSEKQTSGVNPELADIEKLLPNVRFGRLITFDDDPPTTDDGLKSDSYNGDAVLNCEPPVPTLLLTALFVKLCRDGE